MDLFPGVLRNTGTITLDALRRPGCSRVWLTQPRALWKQQLGGWIVGAVSLLFSFPVSSWELHGEIQHVLGSKLSVLRGCANTKSRLGAGLQEHHFVFERPFPVQPANGGPRKSQLSRHCFKWKKTLLFFVWEQRALVSEYDEGAVCLEHRFTAVGLGHVGRLGPGSCLWCRKEVEDEM